MKEYLPLKFKMNSNNSNGYMHRCAILWCVCAALIFNYIAFLCSFYVWVCVCVFIVLLFKGFKGFKGFIDR